MSVDKQKPWQNPFQAASRNPTSLKLDGLTILLVEDELEVAYLLIYLLENLGATVLRAFSATEALEILEQQQPELLICDLRLPDASGLWLIQQIRSRGISPTVLPAIAITSYARDFDQQTALNAGFQRYLPKPIDPNELAREILYCTQH